MAGTTDPLDRLFVVPPEEFVATRNALVKELRKAGQRDEAAAIAALRRPTVQDWALNVVAREQPDELEPFLVAAERSREAQRQAAAGEQGADLRGAIQELRGGLDRAVRAATGVAKQAGKATAPLAAPLAARLQEVAGSAALSDLLRDGRLDSVEPDDDEPFDTGAPTAPVGRAKRAGPAEQPKEDAEPAPKADARAVRQLEQRLARAEARLQETEEAAASAARQLEEASARAQAAAERVEEAERALQEAREELESAQHDEASARTLHERAQVAVEEAREGERQARDDLTAAQSDEAGRPRR